MLTKAAQSTIAGLADMCPGARRTVPSERWTQEDIDRGCGYALVHERLAEDWVHAPAQAGGWIAVATPFNAAAVWVEQALREAGMDHDADRFEGWSEASSTYYLAALTPEFMRRIHPSKRVNRSAAEVVIAAIDAFGAYIRKV